MKCSLVSLIILRRSLVFPILLFSSISLHWLLRRLPQHITFILLSLSPHQLRWWYTRLWYVLKHIFCSTVLSQLHHYLLFPVLEAFTLPGDLENKKKQNSFFQTYVFSLSFSHLLFTSLLFTAICKASSGRHFAFLHFFSLRIVLIPASCTVSRTSSIVHQALCVSDLVH